MLHLSNKQIDLPTLQTFLGECLTHYSPLIIAIDGRCGAGKTTLASILQQQLGAVVISADDFFLRPEQRTPERFAQPGGNMDRERLAEEVLIPLREGRPFSYRPFDCHTLTLGEPIQVETSPLIIVEGSYSCHPDLWDYYDLHVFVDVVPDEQIARITRREGAEKAEVFKARWIPLEERYFSHYGVQEKCDAVIRL